LNINRFCCHISDRLAAPLSVRLGTMLPFKSEVTFRY
jgi:hypothetical protein